jgi:hypothetical protein
MLAYGIFIESQYEILEEEVGIIPIRRTYERLL